MSFYNSHVKDFTMNLVVYFFRNFQCFFFTNFLSNSKEFYFKISPRSPKKIIPFLSLRYLQKVLPKFVNVFLFNSFRFFNISKVLPKTSPTIARGILWKLCSRNSTKFLMKSERLFHVHQLQFKWNKVLRSPSRNVFQGILPENLYSRNIPE